VLGPLSLPVGFVAGVVYDPEFRNDVDQRFPELGACLACAAYIFLFKPPDDTPR
jgi:hypothetical protein